MGRYAQSTGGGRTAEGAPFGAPSVRHEAGLAAGSEPVADLVGPEALQADERLVHAVKVVVRDAPDRLDRAGMLVVERLHDLVHRPALVGEADPHRAPVDPR